MSLFGDLPPPTAHLRPKQENLEQEYKVHALPTVGLQPKDEPEGHEDVDDDGHPNRPDKRPRTEEPSSGGLSEEQVSAALTKIRSHISNPDKFSKASGLLRQLLDSGALSRAHRDQLFETVKAAFSDFDNASETSLRRDYMKLIHSLEKRADQLLSRAQRQQVEVYHIVGFTQNEMHTDDSFVFNKVLGRIKEAVAALPPKTEEDEEALGELQAEAAGISSSDDEEGGREGGGGGRGDGGGDAHTAPGSSAGVKAELTLQGRGEGEPQQGLTLQGRGEGQPQQGLEMEAAGLAEVKEEPAGPLSVEETGPVAAGGIGDDYEADPFGLDQLLPAAPQPKRPPPPPPPPPPQAEAAAPTRSGGDSHRSRRAGAAWSAAQALVMRRQALVECLITARSFHKTPWARTGVELLVEHYNKHRERFTSEQQVAVDEMVRFVRAARQARPTGPSQKEINRDTTSFERARSEWSKVHVSARGKVGAQGDAKSQNWLG